MNKTLTENVPIYVQIMDRVREAIVSGELKPGQKMTTVRELAVQFEVNPNTAQRALMELEREGLLASERTSGRFITKDEELIRKLKTEVATKATDKFIAEMKALGMDEKEVLDFFRERCEVAFTTEVKAG